MLFRYRCFNPRPRAGGDYIPHPLHLDIRVSIHAPVRGATFLFRCLFQTPTGFNPRPRAGGDADDTHIYAGGLVFQSTPPCGGRHKILSDNPLITLFQSTPPCGGRQGFTSILPPGKNVSIHAPVRGATNRLCMGATTLFCFNPRPRAGGDDISLFPFTRVISFNPRPRAGGDHLFSGAASVSFLFQSTPPCGGRPLAEDQRCCVPCFNPRPRAGGDRLYLYPSTWEKCFNPRPRAGGDRMCFKPVPQLS